MTPQAAHGQAAGAAGDGAVRAVHPIVDQLDAQGQVDGYARESAHPRHQPPDATERAILAAAVHRSARRSGSSVVVLFPPRELLSYCLQTRFRLWCRGSLSLGEGQPSSLTLLHHWQEINGLVILNGFPAGFKDRW